MEKWLPVVGYEENYEVSDNGKVRNRKTKNEIVQTYINGYKRVNLWKENKYKSRRVHRLVAEAFIDNPLNKRTVNHIDGDKTNNNVDNLEWMTHSENNKHAYNSGLKTNNMRVLVDGVHEFVSQYDAAKFLGVRQGRVSAAIAKERMINGHTIKPA